MSIISCMSRRRRTSNGFSYWLEAVAEDHIGDDRVEWFRSFVAVPELIDNDVAVAMEKIVSE